MSDGMLGVAGVQVSQYPFSPLRPSTVALLGVEADQCRHREAPPPPVQQPPPVCIQLSLSAIECGVHVLGVDWAPSTSTLVRSSPNGSWRHMARST